MFSDQRIKFEMILHWQPPCCTICLFSESIVRHLDFKWERQRNSEGIQHWALLASKRGNSGRGVSMSFKYTSSVWGVWLRQTWIDQIYRCMMNHVYIGARWMCMNIYYVVLNGYQSFWSLAKFQVGEPRETSEWAHFSNFHVDHTLDVIERSNNLLRFTWATEIYLWTGAIRLELRWT